MDVDEAFARVVSLATALPEIEVGKSYGTPALLVKGKAFVRMKDDMDNVLVTSVPLGLKDALMEAEPGKYFETPHYVGWAVMLVRLDAVSDAELKTRIETAWVQKASARLKKAYGV